jgi:hypothetical protein
MSTATSMISQDTDVETPITDHFVTGIYNVKIEETSPAAQNLIRPVG